jgi:hypothetical protein
MFSVTRTPVTAPGRDVPQGGFTWGKSAPVPGDGTSEQAAEHQDR